VGILDTVFRPVRAVFGVAEHTAEQAMPVREIEDIQKQILEGVGALRHATESIESHVDVVESLAEAVPTLTTAVQSLTLQLAQLVEALAPITAAERGVAQVEHEFSRLGGLFGHEHRRTADETHGEHGQPDPPQPPGESG